MKTKIVYVLVSNINDIYLQQAYLSIWSCKYHNPESKIHVVTDFDTKNYIETYPELNSLITNIWGIELDKSMSGFEKSRYLKTKLREVIEGDFLFLDTDTIICGNIDEIDQTDAELAIVPDLHCEFLQTHPFKNDIIANMNRLFDVVPNGKITYYNSGVIFVKDSEQSRKFYQKWHQNWKISKKNPGGMFDQQPLLKTCIDMPNVVKPLSGDYNVQVLGCIKHLVSGKIIHFFNANWGQDSVHPFLNKSYYKNIIQNGKLSETAKFETLHCKELFSTPTFVIGSDSISFWLSKEVSIARKLYSSRFIHHIISKIFYLRQRFHR